MKTTEAMRREIRAMAAIWLRKKADQLESANTDERMLIVLVQLLVQIRKWIGERT